VTTTRPKPLPRPTPETAPFWEGCKQHELRLPFCTACQRYFFYPRRYCPNCLSDAIAWHKASGRGTLHTYIINHRPAPGFEQDAPYVIAIVQLDEGPRLMTNIVNVEPRPENLIPDMPVEVVFEDVNEEITLPKFQPVRTERND
jgi:uncharacterized OB-fold protein